MEVTRRGTAGGAMMKSFSPTKESLELLMCPMAWTQIGTPTVVLPTTSWGS